MKNKIIIITFIFISTLFLGCSYQLCLQKRTERLIDKSHKETDTVYLYSVAFNNYNLVWYHKDNFIHSFKVKPHNTEQYKPIEAKNIALNNDTINKYFDNFLFKNIQCFESVLDGAWIKLYIKNKEPLFSNIDAECLFNTKFKSNSFPYKLQYDFFKLGKSPIDFNFEKMYVE
jgi:hypothetical protein